MVRAAYAGMPYIITVSTGRGFNYRFHPNWKIVLNDLICFFQHNYVPIFEQ